MADDLRTLAQAVVDAPYGSNVWRAAMDAAEEHLGVGLDSHAVTRILAALDAADAQGYARAMGEVETLCTTRCHGTKPRNEHSDYTLGWLDATDAVASWARERLPAAAERD